MKILRIYLKLPPLKGGMEQHIKQLSIEQIKLGYEVIIAYNSGEGVSLSDIRVLSSIPLYKSKPQFFGVFVFYALLVIKLTLKPIYVDVIHIHGGWSSLVFKNVLKRLTRAKIIVYSNHGSLDGRHGLLKRFLDGVDLIHCTGFETGEKILTLTNKNVFVQPSGIRSSFTKHFDQEINRSVEQPTILVVANLLPVKNIDFVLKLAKELPDFKFDIIGDGPLRYLFLEQLKQEKITNVYFLGGMNDEELVEKYRQSHIFLLTSLKEGFPTVVLEAMAFGLPIVSSNAGNLRRLVEDYKNGFVIDDFSINAFKDKILQVTYDTMLWSRISQNNIKLAENYTWEKVCSNITNKTIQIVENEGATSN